MGRKRNDEGVRAASSSSIEIDFYYEGRRFRERIKKQPTAANLARAARHRAAIIDAIERGEFHYPTTFPNSKNAKQFMDAATDNHLTVGSYLEQWLDAKAPTIKSSTADGYRKIINGRLVPALGDIPLTELTRPQVRDMCKAIKTTNKRLANILSVLRAALSEAVEDKDKGLDTNCIAGWTYTRTEPPREEDYVDPFTAADQAAILAALPEQGRNMMRFALWTGLRTSELIALRWGDIDFNRNEATVRRALTQAAKGKAEAPKTRNSARTIKLLAPAMAALEAQKAHTFLAGESVFHNPRTNEPWTGDGPIRKSMWQPALRRAGVRYRIPYQTRHTFASMMLSAGENPWWVARQMGHADLAMLRRVYGRWMPDADPEAGHRAEALFDTTAPKANKTKTG